MGDWLDPSNAWIIYPFGLVAIVVATWVGRRIGARVRRRATGGGDHLPTIQGALVALLSLLIGFTLSASLARFEARRTAVLHEAVAISAARDRAILLPAARQAQAERFIDTYLGTRIGLDALPANSRGRLRREAQSRRLIHILWREAADLLNTDDRSQPGTLFAQALDGLGEAAQARTAADVNQVPEPVFIALYALALVAWGYIGYSSGVRGAHNAISNILLGAAFATVIAVVADLDSPTGGFIQAGQGPLLALQASSE